MEDFIKNEIVEESEIINISAIEQFFKELPEFLLQLSSRVLLAIVFLFLGIQCTKMIRKIVKKSLKKANADTGVIQFLDSFVKAILYLILIFMVATNFGLDAASVIAVVGSVGVAIGLALQGSLSNLAGGVLILLLKPFRVGDYIIEDSKGNEGTVTEIQLFYTKLTTPDHKIVVLPNGSLANTSLTNATTTPMRRLDLQVGISYSADLLKAKEVIETLLLKEERTLKEEPIQVFVHDLGQSAVIIGARCWVKNDDYWPLKWMFTEEIKLALDKNGIEIPFAQLDIHMKG